MRKCRIGVLGTSRGKAMMRFCANTDIAELVAVCDNQLSGIEQVKAAFGAEGISFYSSCARSIRSECGIPPYTALR